MSAILRSGCARNASMANGDETMTCPRARLILLCASPTDRPGRPREPGSDPGWSDRPTLCRAQRGAKNRPIGSGPSDRPTPDGIQRLPIPIAIPALALVWTTQRDDDHLRSSASPSDRVQVYRFTVHGLVSLYGDRCAVLYCYDFSPKHMTMSSTSYNT